MGMFCNPSPITTTNLAALKRKKSEEIRKTALCIGQAGVNIIGSIDPLMRYHMAVTPEDVNLLKQANEVAKIEEKLVGLLSVTAEIKEKWIEEGEEKTRLHPDVPIAIHDAVLGQAILHAKEIYRYQEELIQKVQDASTAEAINQITWR